MDDAIAKMEAENRNPLYLHRIQKAKQLLNLQPQNLETKSEE